MRESHLELLFRIHYHEFDTESGLWTGVRVRRLCNLLQLTQPELARYVRLTPHRFADYLAKEKFPGCVKLVLDLVERSAESTYLGITPSKPLFPNTDPNG